MGTRLITRKTAATATWGITATATTRPTAIKNPWSMGFRLNLHRRRFVSRLMKELHNLVDFSLLFFFLFKKKKKLFSHFFFFKFIFFNIRIRLEITPFLK